MKRISKITLFVFLPLVLSCNNSSIDNNAVIDNVIDVYGELALIKKINDQKQIWNVQDYNGNTLKCFYYYKRPNKLKIEIKSLDGNPIIQTIFNGEEGKHIIFGEAREMSEDELMEYQIIAESWIDRYSIYKKEAFQFLESIRENEVDYLVFEVTNKFDQKHKIFVNKENGMIEIIEEVHVDVISVQPSVRKIVTKSFEKFGQITFPQEIAVFDIENKGETDPNYIRLETVMNNIGIDDSEFSLE